MQYAGPPLSMANGMPVTSLFPARRATLLVLTALLCACASQPRTPPGRLAELQQHAADGRFDSAWHAAETLQGYNDRRALHWYARAAAVQPWTFHNARAEERLGQIWLRGLVANASPGQPQPASAVRPSWRKAERWLLAAARHGNPYAMSTLAQQYRLRGRPALALRWDMRMQVYQRVPSHSGLSGEQLAPRDGTLHPLVAAIQQQAVRGDADAQVDLGTLHERGYGVPRDGALALQWYERAAAQGDAHGQYLAGLLLGRGRANVTADRERAAAWFAKAAQQRFYLAEPEYWETAVKPPTFNFSE